MDITKKNIFPGCNNFFCSLECLKYQDFPEYDVCGLNELTDLTFSCCNTCYCAKCHLQLIDSDDYSSISFCDMCERFYHYKKCRSGKIVDDGFKRCMCRLCVDLKHDKKKIICRSCHVKHNVKEVCFKDEFDILQCTSLYPYDFSDCEKFWSIIEAFESHCHMVFKNPCRKMAIITKKPKPYVLARAWLRCMLENHDCDCNICKNIKCNTLLFRLILHNGHINFKNNYWDEGRDLTPVKALYEYASRPDNDCDCEVCQYWRSYN